LLNPAGPTAVMLKRYIAKVLAASRGETGERRAAKRAAKRRAAAGREALAGLGRGGRAC
jgi:hypothetical protein